MFKVPNIFKNNREACLFGEEYTDYNVSGSKKRAKNTKKTQKLSQRKVNEKSYKKKL